jgi:hypothetical protein
MRVSVARKTIGKRQDLHLILLKASAARSEQTQCPELEHDHCPKKRREVMTPRLMSSPNRSDSIPDQEPPAGNAPAEKQILRHPA